LEKSREILESNPEAYRDKLAMVYKQLGSINIKQEKYDEAEANLNKSNEILAELFDTEHNDMVTNKHNLAHVYLETGRSPEAEKLPTLSGKKYARHSFLCFSPEKSCHNKH
jgi:tetratricopeptide (TPR) repeat protein